MEFFACFLPRADHPIIGLCTLDTGIVFVLIISRTSIELKNGTIGSTIASEQILVPYLAIIIIIIIEDPAKIIGEDPADR